MNDTGERVLFFLCGPMYLLCIFHFMSANLYSYSSINLLLMMKWMSRVVRLKQFWEFRWENGAWRSSRLRRCAPCILREGFEADLTNHNEQIATAGEWNAIKDLRREHATKYWTNIIKLYLTPWGALTFYVMSHIRKYACVKLKIKQRIKWVPISSEPQTWELILILLLKRIFQNQVYS